MASDELLLLRQIAKWTRQSALASTQLRVAAILDTEPKRRLYAALEAGDTSVNVLEKTTGVNHNDIRKWAIEWTAAGLVEAGLGGPKAAFTFAELGWSSPAPRAAARVRADAR